MTKMATAVKAKKKKLQADLASVPLDYDYAERISIPFPLDDISDLKIGQEVIVTITGTVTRLEGEKHYSCIGLEVDKKSFRKTSNSQTEGIRKLSDDDED